MEVDVEGVSDGRALSGFENAPLVCAKRARIGNSRRVPTASCRLATDWTLQAQLGGRKRATCLECSSQFQELETRICRTSDVQSGGRWYHTHCLPGGLRADDTVKVAGQPNADMTSISATQELRNVQAHVPSPPAVAEPADAAVDLQACSDDQVPSSIWQEVLTCKAAIISDLTPNFHTLYADVKADLIKTALVLDDSTEDGAQAWSRLLMVDKLLFHKGGDPGESLNAKLRTRLQSARDGEWIDLIASLLDNDASRSPGSRRSTDKQTVQKVMSLARQESWRRAITAVRNGGGPDRSQTAWTKLQAELPPDDSRCTQGSAEVSLTDDEKANLRTKILKRIRAADGAASCGLLGSPANMWKVMVRQDDAEVTALVIDLFERVAVGRVGCATKNILMHSDLLAGPRPDGRVRPIEVPSFIRKIAIGALMEVLLPETITASGDSQYRFCSHGTTLAHSVIENALSQDSTLVVASIDVKGAHANIKRDSLEAICDGDAPRLAQVLRLWYHNESPKTWRGASTKTRTSKTGVGQGFPDAGPLFCAGLGRAIKRLKEDSPSTRIVAFEDDAYLIDKLPAILPALALARTIWADLGLEFNEVKLKLYTPDASVRASAPASWQDKFVDSLGILGHKLSLRLEEEGLDFTLSSDGEGLKQSLHNALDQLTSLAQSLERLVGAGLPKAVAHKMWGYASKGAIVHLQASDLCLDDLMHPFSALQRAYVKFMAGREPTDRDMSVALLSTRDGGWGLPDYQTSAVTNFLNAQCRILPKVCTALEISSVETLVESRPALRDKLSQAKSRAVALGVLARSVPQPTSAAASQEGSDGGKNKMFVRKIQIETRKRVEENLTPGLRGRLRGQARRGSGLWMQEPLPEGEAPADATWETMLRQRALMKNPGSRAALAAPCQCGHIGVRGRCQFQVCDDDAHENLCNIGGGPGIRHDRVRDWLADKLREAYGGRTLTERPHPLADGTGGGRIDIKHDSAAGHIDIDVTVVSVHSTNAREALRRQTAPDRALRSGIADKLATYGAGVLAFPIDDTGAIGAKALRLLRDMAFTVGGEDLGQKTLQTWRAQLQHIVLQSTAGMAQNVLGAPRTA